MITCDERPLVAIDAYREHVLSNIDPLPATEVRLGEAMGCVLARDERAVEDVPLFATSAMDGFAVRTTDLDGATELRLVGAVAMGNFPEVRVGEGEAVAIPTGGVVPDGADAVVPIELCDAPASRVTVLRGVAIGENIRPAGEDIRAGDVVVEEGRRLFGPELGALASIGLDRVLVRPRARVGVVSTGNELVRPGAPRRRAEIYDANAFTLSGAVAEAGAIPIDGGIARDDAAELLAALERVAEDVDVIVCSGGVSMGERDPVKLALSPRGVDFVEVAMQPGKPQAFGWWAGKPFFGLPGNTVSAFVSFEMFVRPAVLEMMGRTDRRIVVEAECEADITRLDRKTRVVRVRVRRHDGRWFAAPVGGHRSNLLLTMVRGNGLAIIPPGEGVRAGDGCRVLLLREDL